MAKKQIKARVQCTIEVPVGVWAGGMINLEDLAEQVRKEGLEIVRKAARSENGIIVGTPQVLFMVLVEGVEK